MDDLWNWENCRDRIVSLKNRMGFCEEVEFLKLRIDLNTGEIFDIVTQKPYHNKITVYFLLTHYSEAKEVPLKNKLIKYRELPMGNVKDAAFQERGCKRLAEVFGKDLGLFEKVCEYFGGEKREIGDKSYEVKALPLIPLTISIWEEGEFPAEANIFFDESASSYLHSEDLFALGLLTVSRLVKASKVLR